MRAVSALALIVSLGCLAMASACNRPEGTAATSGSIMSGVEEAEASLATENLKAAEDFLRDNRTRSGVTETGSGLQFAVVNSGPADGPRPGPDSIVQVNYEGKLANGTVFDSSFARGQAAEFPVGDLVPAWVEALQLMRPGDEWTIWVHPRIGYGEMGSPPSIPPNALLIFRMRLEKIVAGTGAGTGPGDAGVSADGSSH
jgi:FKBP-type peptidyl-prolyl cis-trans isomerase FklB